MGIAQGARVGPYEVLGTVGAGGMGEVYRARDPRLGREVALKVLPAEVGKDAGRLRRFELEARATGALNHPNVLAVYDVGEHEGTPYIVAELLEGTTLRERLLAGPLPPRKALDFAGQIARGLAAAHDKGIIHRDLKPENVFVTRDGRVKILDFGLAKAVGGEVSATESTLAETEPGAVLGTAGYMAPEQVRGKPTDARADIFAFGTVLYEMLAGRRAFDGDSAIDRAHAILNQEPRPLPGDVPAAVQRLVQRCLEKAPAERFGSARDLGFALEALSDASGLAAEAAAPGRRARVTRPAAVALAAVALVGLGIGVGVGRLSRPRPPALAVAGAPTAAPPVRYTRVTFRNGVLDRARFAEGGRSVVFSGALGTDPWQVFVATPGRPETRAVSPPWSRLEALSPQGEMLLKVAPEGETHTWHLARAALAGGAPRAVLDSFEAADFGPDGSQLVVRRVQGKARLEYPVGTMRLEMTGRIIRPRVSPRGDHVAFLHWPIDGDAGGTVELLDLRTGARRTLAGGTDVVDGLAWRPDGAEVWFSGELGTTGSGVYAVTLAGRPRLVLASPEAVELNDVAPDGRALIRRNDLRIRTTALIRPAARESDLSWFDGTFVTDLTPDGRWLLFGEGRAALGRSDGYLVFVRRTDGGPAIAVGTGAPVALSPDGAWALIAPGPAYDRLTLVPTGPGEARSLPGTYAVVMGGSFFPDGRRILAVSRAATGGWRLWIQDLTGGAPRPFGPEGITDSTPPSPDGTRVVVIKDKAAFVVPVDGGAPQPLPRIRPGDVPVQWTADGKGLYLRRRPSAHPRHEVVVVVHDLATGKERPWRVLVPPDPVGVLADHQSAFPWLVTHLAMTPDGTSYAYSYWRSNSDFYVVEGLR